MIAFLCGIALGCALGGALASLWYLRRLTAFTAACLRRLDDTATWHRDQIRRLRVQLGIPQEPSS